jgi:hypothetical protein
MPIVHAGTLPVAALNIGLAAAPTGLSSAIAKLSANISQLTAALTTQLSVTAIFPPNLPGFAAQFGLALNPAGLLAAFNPANWVTLNAGANVELAAQLGFIEAQLAIVAALAADFQAGVSAPVIAGWSYAGRAARFGPELETATRSGFGRTAPNTQIRALIIATENFASWGSFSQGFRTGFSGTPAETTDARLVFLGELGGGEWNSGVQSLLSQFNLLLAELQGTKVTLHAQIALSLGIDLPDPTVIVDAGLSIDLDAALGNLVNVQADLTAEISGLQARIDALLELVANISIQLSAGGLSFWTYSGTAGDLGTALRAELQHGLPGGSGPGAVAYGLALAGAPASMSLFGSIFKTL